MIKNDSVRVKVNLIDSNIKWIYEDLKWISKLSEKSGQIISCEESNILSEIGRVKDMLDEAKEKLAKLNKYELMTKDELLELVNSSEKELNKRNGGELSCA